MLDFQRYQLAFTAHIRDPKTHPKPKKVADSGMAIYREIVFNNLVNAVSSCFPVCQNVLGKRKWLQLCRTFFANHQSTTPFFREIPAEFVRYIKTDISLAPYIAQLAHYEWIELKLGCEELRADIDLSQHADLQNEIPVMAPVHALLEYDYPVQLISKNNKPKAELKTYLLVYRTRDFKIKFIELNPIAFLLLSKLETMAPTGQQTLEMIAREIDHLDTNAIVRFGLEVLEDLAGQQAIIGSVKPNVI